MVLSEVSIKRPVFATVLSLVIVIFGLFAFQKLSVREYPNIDPPIITVSTIYRGASAEIIETQITQIIEDSVSGIEGIKSINSSSREESSAVSIEFNLSRDVDIAANDVRDKVSRVLSRLPAEADSPVIAKAEQDSRPIMWLALQSSVMSPMDLTDYASRFLVDRLATVNGVAQVTIGGERKYSMRVSLDRAAMAARALTVQDIEAAIRRQNVELPSGRIESVQREFSVRTDTGLRTPEEFRNIVVKQSEGYLVRMGEVARIELQPENDRSDMLIDGQQTIGLGIYRQSTANALEISKGVKTEMERVNASLPPGMTLRLRFDSSLFIDQSIYEVYHATMIALALVIGVIFLFLRSWRATLIPAVAIPVSIIGSFIILGAMGYSLNVLTLLALILAIGLVVDDAIVVLENIHRRIEEGEPPLVAAVRGANQIGFAVIATTVVLIAVFVPISLLDGNTGRLFREFGIAVAAAVLFSGFVALTLTPMMCSKLLKPHGGAHGWFYRVTERGLDGVANGYRWTLARTLGAPVITLAVGAGTLAAIWIFFAILPKEFAPLEDRGVFFVQIQGPEGSSLDYTRRYALEIERRMRAADKTQALDGVMVTLAPGFNRPGPTNEAFAIANLKHWHDRDIKQQDLVKEAFPAILGVPGVRAFAINPPSLGQSAFQAPLQMVIGGPAYDIIDEWADRILARAVQNPQLLNVQKNYQPTRPELRVAIDRDKAADLGISLETIGRTLETMLGQRQVTTFERDGKQYNVIVRGRGEDRAQPSDLANIYVRSSSNKLVPLSNLVTMREAASARDLQRVDRMRTVTVSASLAPGYTLGEAIEFAEKLGHEELPVEARLGWRGQSREFKEASSALYFTFALAVVIVFLALAAQFESWIHPTIIILTVPLAVAGALASLWATGQTVNVFSQIGIIMLVGLIAKNAILIVEFANQLRDEGRNILDAVSEASVVRLRPILMTTIATIGGAWPLAVATGAGAESRQALGIVIIGGMAVATLLGLYIVPVLYLLLARFTKPAGAIARRLSQLSREHPASGGAVGHGQGAPAE